MKLLTSLLFASFFVSNVISLGLTCKVGDDYKSKSSVSNIGGYWYLNVEVPATCSGSIDQYKLRYYDDSLNEDEYYYATLAIWKQTGGGSYEKDNNTILSHSFHFDDRRRKRDLQTERPSLSSSVGVRKGSVIGVYLGTSNPIQAIGGTSDDYISGVPTGVCRTAGSISAITIDCSDGSNMQDQILHAEASITVVDCGNVPNVNNAIATLVDGDTQYGATVQYNCSIGYMPIGNSIITCPLSGSWPTPLTCTIVECYEPEPLVNGQIFTMGNNFTYGSTVTFSCDTGYERQGNETALCQANGQWSSDIPLCLIIDCPDPGIPNNGLRNSSNFSYGASISFTCSVGYELSGNSVIICEGGKKWNGSIPTCNITYCNDPGVPANGSATPSNFSYGTIVSFQCNIGFELSGSVNITCQADNNWDNNLPTCTLVTCPNPITPVNGYIEGSLYTLASVIIYHCNPSYYLDGNNTAQCQVNKTWSINVPTCLKICDDPGTPNNSLRVPSNPILLTEGLELTFHCITGYTLQGTSSITCLSSGEWSHPVPICVPDCSDPGIPDHGSRSPVHGPYNNGTTVSFLCNDGYKLNGESSIMCVSGQWSEFVPQCISSIPTSKSDNTNTKTVIYSSTPAPSGQPSDKVTYNKEIIIGVAVGVSLIFIILIIIMVTLFVWRLHHRTGKMIVNPKDSGQEMSAITNPMMFIPDLYDLATPNFFEESTPYEVPVQTLHNQITSKSHPGNLNEDDINTALEDIESNEKGLYEQEDNDNAIEGELPPPLYFTLDQCLSTESTSIEGGIPQPLYFILEKDTATPQPVYFTLERTSSDENMTTNTTLSQAQQPIYFTLEPPDHRSSNEGGNNQPLYFTLNQPGRRTCDEGGNNLPHYFTLDQTRHATGINEDGINQSLYFTLDQTGHCTSDQSAVDHFSHSTLNQVGKRKTMIYQQPGENEDELYGQIKKSHVASLSLNDLQLGDTIGSGQFGNVQKAVWQKSNGESIEVAVKTLQEGSSEKEKIKFLQEAMIMSQFNHANVIKLYGVVADDNLPMIVVEYMPKGDLRGVLYKFKPDPGELANSDVPILLLSFSRQICLGMTYLSGKGFVHRDLAARNILVSADNICKIIDFGLSRDLEDENYYVSHKGAMIPVKWTAPEALNYRKYSTASDVWSYGCLLYEIWSLGHKPYEKFSNIQVLEKICSGYRLPPPPGCSKTIYNIMMSCWNPNSKERPTFNDIMLLLLQNDKTLLAIPEDALSTHPQAGVLGATLKAGEQMYMNIQSKYMDIMGTAL